MNFFKKFFDTFFYLDLRSLALFRVCLGGLLIADLIDRIPDLTAMYTDFGLLPREILIHKSPYSWSLSLHMISGRAEIQIIFFIIAGFFALMVLVGYRTTLATIASWILLVSLQNRNSVIIFGSDQVLRLLLFWGMFLPWHARFSVDAALKKTILLQTRFVSGATVAYILQIIFIYTFSVLLKTSPWWRTEGTAVYYALAMSSFRTSFGEILFHMPYLLKPITHSVFIFEAFGSLLLFVPYKKDLFRFFAVIGFVGLHIGFGLHMRLGFFPWVCSVAWLTLLPSGFWNILLEKIKNPRTTELVIYYDHACGFCYNIVKILKTFLLLPQTHIKDANSESHIASKMIHHNSWVIVDHLGKYHYKYNGFLAIANASPLLFISTPILSTSPIKMLGNYLYKLISTHRKKHCNINQNQTQFNAKFSYTSKIMTIVALFFIVYIFFWNLYTLYSKKTMPFQLYSIGLLTGLNQKWGLFAPRPPHVSGWYIIIGKMKDGSFYDLYNNRSFISFAKPPSVITTYKTARWARYLTNISDKKKYPLLASAYTAYICRSWNAEHSDRKQVMEVELIYVTEYAKLDYIYNTSRLSIDKRRCN